ncbi:class I SAM-dependent methyltransferase [Halorubrum trueperi]|uniref:Class I SAM-dependent methyltransferase n=1 Tax=Halorubrum trueperi TaxID=2004704 RepID=A0ABD5UJ64_9EURY
MARGWKIQERRHAGEEHLDAEAAARFDEKSPFDPSTEIDTLLELGLTGEDTVVDFGTGTGVFPLAAAEYCDRVVAVDVSESMVKIVDEKIEATSIQNIETVHDGFLSYDHQGDAAAYAFSKDALHHLPDFWKVEALKAIGTTLEEGGMLRLRDFVFSFDPQDSQAAIESWLDDKRSTSFTEEELHVHFREEFSTYGFLLEQMLAEAGFEIIDATYETDFYAEYTCQWHGFTE